MEATIRCSSIMNLENERFGILAVSEPARIELDDIENVLLCFHPESTLVFSRRHIPFTQRIGHVHQAVICAAKLKGILDGNFNQLIEVYDDDDRNAIGKLWSMGCSLLF